MKTKPSSPRRARARGSALHRITRIPADTSPVIELVPSRLKLGTILVPVDFSPTSLKALQYAVPFAEQFGARLTFLYVCESQPMPDFAFFPIALDDDRMQRRLEARLDGVRRKAGIRPGLVERLLVRHGVPFHEITEAARSLKADLIILTTHGHTGLKHALLGSTAERVVRHAPCPVLVVREHEHEFV